MRRDTSISDTYIKYSECSLDPRYMPSDFHSLFHVILKSTQWGGQYYPHVIDKGDETKRICIICPRSRNWLMTEQKYHLSISQIQSPHSRCHCPLISCLEFLPQPPYSSLPQISPWLDPSFSLQPEWSCSTNLRSIPCLKPSMAHHNPLEESKILSLMLQALIFCLAHSTLQQHSLLQQEGDAWPDQCDSVGVLSREPKNCGLIPGQDTCLGCGFGPWSGHVQEAVS